MKQNKHPQNQNQTSDGAPRPTTAELNQNEINFTPSPDEVARRARFS
jgi:hypothetical protein